ncbi:hypothetical protein AAG570_002172 [Ranatra chinensis]|uniref:Calponin-homology (CH) domain-containing protein n=1 Tax=Ranatra chinensis TaxID=642074 RepID=A0ABD0Y7S1_9HEMI
MSEVLLSWIRRRLGASLEFNMDTLGRHFFDGKLYFKLLLSYNIIHEETTKTLVTAHNSQTAMKNLNQLCFWLKLLGVNYTNKTIREISEGNPSACVTLLFALYVCLENKETWYFVTKKRAQQMVRQPGIDKFVVQAVSEKPPGAKPDVQEYGLSPYAMPLYKKREMVDGYRTKFYDIIRQCKQDSQWRREVLLRMEKQEAEKRAAALCGPRVDQGENEVCRTSKEITDFTSSLNQRKDEVIECSPQNYISLLKVIRRKEDANKELTAKMHTRLLKEVWAKILEDRQRKFDEEFAARLARQSEFEKQMCLRLGRIHRQNKVFVENKKALQRLAETYQESAQYFEDTYVVLAREEDEDAKTERLRVALLHRKLYAQKLRLKAEKHCKLCREIAQDLADYAVKIAEAKAERGEPVPKRVINEWKALFYKSLPIFLSEDEETILERSLRKQELTFLGEGEDAMEDMTEVRMSAESDSEDSDMRPYWSTTSVEEEEFVDYDFLIRLDLEAVEEVNEQNLHDYMYMLGPWRYEIWPELGSPNGEENVLGFVVHRLLEFKYPLPLPPDPPDLPAYSTKVVLNNANDKAFIEKLKMLLTKPAIAVIDAPTAVNYCVEEYVKYADPEEVKDFLAKREKATKKGSKKESSKKGKSKGESAFSKQTEKPPPEPNFKDIETQVPSFIDPGPPRIPTQAEILGQMAVEALNSGQPASDILLVKCLIEYLRSLENIDGWVLLNYPQVCSQIELLEFTLTSVVPSVVCSSAGSEVQMYINKELHIPVDKQLLNSRTSKLVPRTTLEPPKPVFFPYFSQYIELKSEKNVQKSEKEKKKKVQLKVPPSEDDLDDEEFDGPILMEDSTPESFYEGYGVYKSFVYKTFDLPTLIDLARAILGLGEVDFELRVPSEEIFGAEVLNLLKPKKDMKGSKNGDKKSSNKSGKTSPKSAKEKGSTKESKKKKKEKSDSPIEEVTPLVVEEMWPEEESVPEEVLTPVETSPPKPGDVNWTYSELPIDDQLQIILATIWESVESNYFDSLKQIFFMCRVQNSIVIPYRNYVRNVMEEIITRPDNRQEYVTEFQQFLNNVPDELRHKTRVKAELHCRVFELQERLNELSDAKKNLSESKRREFISHNWLASQLTILANVYICMLRVEADRFIDTLQLLYDYSLGCLGLVPDPRRLEKLEVRRLKRPTLETPDPSESTVSNKSKRLSKSQSGSLAKRGSKKSNAQDQARFSVMELLLNSDVDKDRQSSLHSAFSAVADHLAQQILTVSKLLREAATHVFKPAPEKVKKKKEDKKENSKKKRPEITAASAQEPPDPKQKLCDEWEKAVEDETYRVIFRVSLIVKRGLADMSEVQSIMQNNFHGFYNEIVNVYKRDMSNIAALCSLLRTAIEEETAICPQLILGTNKFRVDRNSLMFEVPPPPPPTPLQELSDDYFFTVVQLRNLLSTMKRVAPVGIAKEAFLDVLEDMTLFGRENGYPYTPKCWSQLSRQELRFLLDCAFGDALLIDWRDFIVFALNLPFPSVEQIVEAREKYLAKDADRNELITKADFEDVLLWFEKYFAETLEENLRNALIKQFLFDLYNVGDDTVNYTALLLAFCRDEDPIEGFGKALALASGTGVIMRRDMLFLIQEEMEEEMRHRESREVVDQTMLQLLTDVMQHALGVVVHEIEEGTLEETIEEEAEEEVPGEVGGMSGEELEAEEVKRFKVKWVAIVSYELVVTVLLSVMHFYALSAEHEDRQVAFERGLEEVFRTLGDSRGVHMFISGFALAESDFIADLLSRVYLFKSCDVVGIVNAILVRKYSADSSNFSSKLKSFRISLLQKET